MTDLVVLVEEWDDLDVEMREGTLTFKNWGLGEGKKPIQFSTNKHLNSLFL